MDVAEWLRELGLEQYAPAFRGNDIDGEVLCRLTADDLRELGVASIGHRRRLLDAIAALVDAQPAAEASPAPAPAAAGEAERRQLTVMFCDLVGSTALSARFDPEDLREIVGAYHRCVADTIARFAGFVAKYMGDGVLIYFGYPEAHEDDAERAVRAGLAVIDAVGRLAAPERLNVRLGIASGLVVVGDLIGAGAAQERGVVGETPNLAARLQGLAQTGSLVIAESTRRQIGRLFEIEDLGPQPLAGFTEPQRAWRVIGESGTLSRFEALRSEATALVGRDEELELLLRRWRQAKAGEGRVVLISGEPGIGKSRLVAALSQAIESDPHTRLRYFCSLLNQDSALHPFIVQLERAAGFARDDTVAQKLGKLRGLLAPGARGGDEIVLLAELLSLPSSAVDFNLSPQRKREKLFDALLHQLAALAQNRPVLMIFEDAHWVDPTSRELLDLTLDRVSRLPVLLIITFRPEFQHAWGGEPHVTVLALNRLGGRNGAALVEALAGNAALPHDIIDEIVERADGVPLFVEELTKAVLESSDRDNRVAAVLGASPMPSLAIPATLHASLIARLDRLGPIAKEVAQIGAVLGRDFGYELVEQVARRPAAELRSGLDRLVEAGLLFRRGVTPQSSYMFKHALVQDAAYGTLLRGPRQLLHGRVADALLSDVGENPTVPPEIMAHHMQNAGRSVEAVKYWREAGELAVRCAANREAIGHFGRALSLLEAQPETVERSRTELATLSQLGPALMSVHGWTAPEAGEVVERAAEIGHRLASSADLAPAIANLCLFNLARGRLDRAAEIAVDVFRIGRELGDPEVILQAHHCAWFTNWDLGRFAEAREHTDAGAALYDEVRHAHHRHVYLGHDPGVCMMNFGASLQTVLGYPVQGHRLAEESIVLARRLGHTPSLANALWHVCEPAVFRGDPASVMLSVQELLSMTDAHGLPMHHAHGVILLGWALSHSGEMAEGIARLNEGQEMLTRWGSRDDLSFYLGLIADSLLVAERYNEGLDQVSCAIDLVAETGARWYEAPLYWMRAQLLLHAQGASDAVETSLRQAIAVAQQQGAKLWELGAVTSLARLWGEQGRRAEAHGLLAPIYGWFTEGFDTADLKEAKALLDGLA
jgi:class 3 adenylate cyclase/predicted ATPase